MAGILYIPFLGARVSLLGQKLGREAFLIFQAGMKEAGWERARQEPAHHGTPIVVELFKKVSKPDCGLRGKLDLPPRICDYL